ncbi:hypothetical protein VNO80_25065 [Phaseolus coccineus]|uniref:Uncharacterized protein n=1 Tax=Phaseolus coccineus TaxID=3886 RepID=A0AAN9QNL9_PHACN
MENYGFNDRLAKANEDRRFEEIASKDSMERGVDDWRAGLLGGSEVGGFVGSGPAIVEAEQSGVDVGWGGGAVGAAWPVVGEGQDCLGASYWKPLQLACSQERDVLVLKVDEGVRSQLGHDGSFLCCLHKGEVQEEVVGEGVVSSPFE